MTTRDIAVTVLKKRDNNVTDIMSITGFSSSAFLEALRNHQVISLNKDWVSGRGYVHVVKFTWGGGGGGMTTL